MIMLCSHPLQEEQCQKDSNDSLVTLGGGVDRKEAIKFHKNFMTLPDKWLIFKIISPKHSAVNLQ